MTENQIFKILLKNVLNIDFPKLQERSASVIAKHLSDILYDTLKQKSCTSVTRRSDILKLINTLSGIPTPHFNEGEVTQSLVNRTKCIFNPEEDADLSNFLKEGSVELHSLVPNSLAEEVIAFNKRRDSRSHDKTKQLEFIKNLEQERLKQKLDCQVRKNHIHYETNENVVRNLLHQKDIKIPENKTDSFNYREKQIKYGYALLNLKLPNGDDILYKILIRLSRYNKLLQSEIHFIQNVWAMEGDKENLSSFVVNHFHFVLEKILLGICTDLLKLECGEDLEQYFYKLRNHSFKQIEKLCKEDAYFHYKVQCLIDHLYCYSYCNKNILRLSDCLKFSIN